MAAEAGHEPNRCYIDQNGDLHLNGAKFFNDAEVDMAPGLESVGSVSAAEMSFVDGATAGAAVASKAVVLGSDLTFQGGKRVVEAHTADDTLTTAESGSVHTSVGASGTITLTLPAAVVGLEYFFRVGAAQQFRIDPNGTETIALPSTGVQGAAGKYLVADADGESVHLLCDKAGQWTCYGFTGTWTAEA